MPNPVFSGVQRCEGETVKEWEERICRYLSLADLRQHAVECAQTCWHHQECFRKQVRWLMDNVELWEQRNDEWRDLIIRLEDELKEEKTIERPVQAAGRRHARGLRPPGRAAEGGCDPGKADLAER